MRNKIGVITSLQGDKPCFTELKRYNLSVCQLASWDPTIWTDQLAEQVANETRREGIQITAFWTGYCPPHDWNFITGPITLGLVPQAYRARRVTELILAGSFAKKINLPAIITHVGFIPENACDPLFQEIVIAVRLIAEHLHQLGMEFWFETGQETPVTLLRMIRAVNMPNLGINLDPANLILYGKGNPIDALDVFGKYVRNIHAKDGLYPTDPMKLGEEVKVGTGKVRFPEFVRRLKEIGFSGEFIIEREISGKDQARDILATIKYLQKLLKATK